MGRLNALAAILLLLDPAPAAATETTQPIPARDDPHTVEVATAPSVPAVWAVDPTEPGDDLPARGHSVFDAIFSVHKNGAADYELPFPFTALIKKIESNLNKGDRAQSRLRQVLIPMGRSLQRHAAAPDYFKHPRIVVAVDSAFADPGLVPVKDRLFLGYQQKANIIEVISYNEDGGRFEFQIVRNYAENSNPRVFYARRQVCVSCHQNGAPMFSVAAWSETAANPNVSRRLYDEHSSYNGIPIDRSALDAFAVDAASDRANLFSVYQRLWREGCGDDTQGSRQCRAAAFTAMLQYRLTGRTQFDTRSVQYREHFLDPFTDNWGQRWPGGIKVPNPDLPNRDPLSSPASLSARLDPLVLRPPLEIWSLTRPSDVEPMIKGIAEFLPERGVRELDTYLFERGRPTAAAGRLTGTCELRAKQTTGSAYRISFDCQPLQDARRGFSMEGRIYTRGHQVTDGVIDVLRLNSGERVSRLKISGGGLAFEHGSWQVDLDLFQQPSGLHARLPNGSAVRLRLRWAHAGAGQSTSDPVSGNSMLSGVAVLFTIEDFARVHRAIDELKNAKGNETFSSNALHGARAMRSLLARLGMGTAGQACCTGAATIPRARVDDGGLTGLSADTAGFQVLQPFFQYCAGCHQSPATFPPNFLSGDPGQVRHSLANCAQRIWYRLGMWDVPAPQRPKSPMPPITTLGSGDVSAQQWVQSDGLIRLRSYIAAVLDVQNIDTESLITRDYKTLRECASHAG